MFAREYPYEKSVLLNAAYDVFDRMAIPVSYADSRAGILRFDTGEMALTALLRDGAEVTRVEVSDTGQELGDVLLDELHAALQKCFETKRRVAV